MEPVQAFHGTDSINIESFRFLHRTSLFYTKDNIYRQRFVIFIGDTRPAGMLFM